MLCYVMDDKLADRQTIYTINDIASYTEIFWKKLITPHSLPHDTK